MACLRAEVRALESIMERIEAMGPHQVHEYEIGGVMDAPPNTTERGHTRKQVEKIDLSRCPTKIR